MTVIHAPLSPKQHEAWAHFESGPARYVCFGGGAGGGKSLLAWMWLVCWSYAYPGTRYFAARNQLSDLKIGGVGTFYKVLAVLGIDRDSWYFHQNEHFLLCRRTGSVIELMEIKYQPRDENWDRLGSREYTAGLIEEAQEADPKAFDTLKARVGRQYNDLYDIKPIIALTFNPHKGWLFDRIYDPWKRGVLPENTVFIRSLHRDNPFLPDTYADSLNDIDDESTRQRLRDGDWEFKNAANQLVNPEWVTAALHVPARDGRPTMGVDVAGGDLGFDDNCIIKIAGNMIFPLVRAQLKHCSSLQAEEKMADLIMKVALEEPIVEARDIRIDTQGPGAGVFSVLRSRGWVCTRFYGGAPSIRRPGQVIEYRNLRGQAAWELREKFQHSRLHLVEADAKAKACWCSYHYEQDERKIALEDKKKTRRRLGRSPDEADALMMAAIDMSSGGGGAAVTRSPGRSKKSRRAM